MDISAILNKAQAKKKTTTASSRKTTVKKSNKRPRLEESTQETRISECHPFTQRKPNKELVTTDIHTSPVLILPAIQAPPTEFVHPIDPLIHIFDPLLTKSPIEAIPLIQSFFPPNIPSHEVPSIEIEGFFPWCNIMKSGLPFVSLSSIF
ncbi:hypothetical protein J1N35_043446 [Gossypium stocksii]|uniref:Uncharacterized protein n=1 Tax=Gossypium stocksii TaxID=47602 RepID=A0A9D3U7F0_9ROSI|nr:hypothetical protein J1N35_043446 [Gossypium stocksii]